jgi:hypothetical protein
MRTSRNGHHRGPTAALPPALPRDAARIATDVLLLRGTSWRASRR